MVHWRSFLFCNSNFRTPMKAYRVCGLHSSKTENRLCNAVKLVPTSKKTTPSRVYRKNFITYCKRTKQNPQGHLKRKILSRQMAIYVFKRRKLPAWRYANQKSHFFRYYWNSFTCKATFRLHARQRCRRSCCRSKAVTYPCHSQFQLTSHILQRSGS